MGKKKMSKSDISDYSRINLLDRSDDINNKIKKAKTDSLEIMGTEALDENGKFKSTVIADRPEAVNLIEIFSALSGLEIKKTIDLFSGKNFKVFKEKLADIVIENITPVGNEVRLLLKDKYESDKKIKNIKSPILIMHGEVDKIVPFWMGKKLYELANQPKYSYFPKYDDHMMEFNKDLRSSIEAFIDSLN